MKKVALVLCLFVVTASAGTASACDLCAIYRGIEAKEAAEGFSIGVFEQFTHFGTVQVEGREIPNTAGQYMDSSITQIIAGYQFNERLGVQLGVPYIYRSFRRPEGAGIQTGSVSGIGDVSLIANYRIYDRFTPDTMFILSGFGGVKFPTGDPDRIREELSEMAPLPGMAASGIHGHDLALGSGSWDVPVGASFFAGWKRVYVTGGVQYAIRTRGFLGYRYANDLGWDLRPGYFLIVEDDRTLGAQVSFSGEAKGKDEFRETPAQDTAITSFYIGPQLTYTWKEKLAASLGADFPVANRNTSLQIVPDYRMHAALSWRF